MSEQHPWTPEYELDEQTVRRAVEEDTDLELRSVAYLGEGWDFFNWLINEHWVFRFPKRHSDIDSLIHEKRLLQALSIPIKHPVFEYWVERPKSFHKPYAGYRFLKGNELIGYDEFDIDMESVGRTMGETLHELHQQQLTTPRVPVDPFGLWKPEIEELLTESLPDLNANTQLAVREAYASYELRERPADQVTTHNDLSSNHILVNDDEQIYAIIDWADAATANRYVDFAGLWTWGGNRALAHTFEHYPFEPSKADLAQIRIHGLSYALEQIAYGNKTGDDWAVETARKWVQRRAESGELSKLYAHL